LPVAPEFGKETKCYLEIKRKITDFITAFQRETLVEFLRKFQRICQIFEQQLVSLRPLKTIAEPIYEFFYSHLTLIFRRCEYSYNLFTLLNNNNNNNNNCGNNKMFESDWFLTALGYSLICLVQHQTGRFDLSDY